MVQRVVTPELQLRKLPYKILKELAEILDVPGPRDWKSLIAELPNEYTRGQIASFERQGYCPGGSSSLSVLTDLGQQLVTVEQLIAYLKAIGNNEALLLLKPHEPVFITRHPITDTVPEHQELVLNCEASGFPLPRYEWFKNGQPIPDARIQNLRFNKVSVTDSGEYICKATNPMGSMFSHPATIQVTPSNVKIGKDGKTANEDVTREMPLPPGVVEEETVQMMIGQHFVLNCDTQNAQYYQWQKNGYELPGACQAHLVFQSFIASDEGRYSCKVTDRSGQVIITKIANLKLLNGPPSQINNEIVPRSNLPSEFATGKMALVIANQNYQSPRSTKEQLVHPFDDATLLQSSLEAIGFKVIRLFDLTKKEMERAIDGFCSILQCAKDLYSLFYFCGHGFEECGKTYLVPVDADTQWTADRAISAEYVLAKIQQSKTTKLDVMLLDVCRIRLGNEKLVESLNSYAPPFMPGAQCVFGYATCPQSMAFEKRGDKNGIYMKHLAANLTENVQIENLLHKVGVDVRKETEHHRLTNSMSPTFKTTTTKTFSLADPILPCTGLIDGEKDPTGEWFGIHRLPASKSIEFNDGIVIDVKFEPVCSNVCYVIIHVASFGEAVWCDAKIIEICEDLEVPATSMNLEHPIYSEFTSKCVSYDVAHSTERSAEIEKWTQVSALQKLTGPFALTIEVQYHTGDRHKMKNQFNKQIFRNDEFGIVQFFNS